MEGSSSPKTTGSRHSGMQDALKANQDNFLRAAICNMLTPIDEEYEMNLIDLQKMSSAELRDLYNRLADRQVKRFESRVEAERRTAQRLQEAGQWEGELPGTPQAGKAKKPGKAADKPAKPARKAAGAADKETPAQGTGGKPEGRRQGGGKPPRQPVAGRGPKSNPSYRILKTDARMNSASARSKVFQFIQSSTKGKGAIDRETIENHFMNDETVNVKSSLDYLVKVEILELVSE